MKKNITAIILIGLFSFTTLGIQAQRYHDDDHDSDNSCIKIIQGKVVNNDHDCTWDYVTFGLDAPDSYEINSVEILDEKSGDLIATVDDLDGFGNHGVSWFRINLNRYNIKGKFILAIHVGASQSTSAPTIMSAPIMPDETVLIIRYP